jgi:hypothetical protein
MSDLLYATTFDKQGWVHVPHYLNPSEINELMTEMECLRSQSFRSFDAHTVYQEEIDTSLPLTHPRNRLQESSKDIIDFSALNEESSLRKIYNRESLLKLIKVIISSNEVYLSGCPYNSA